MSNASGREYLQTIQSRYTKAGKLEKNKILNEFCFVCGYNRKYAIRLLNRKSPVKCLWEMQKRGSKTKYDHPDIVKLLTKIWINTNLPCSNPTSMLKKHNFNKPNKLKFLFRIFGHYIFIIFKNYSF